MYHNKRIIITICARGGSKGIPKKNVRPLLGKPLICYTIEQALELRFADRIVVSTDSREVQRIARSYSIDVPFLRPKYLATDSAPKFPVIQHAVHKAQRVWKESYDINIDLDVTCPLRTTADIDNCLQLLLSTPHTKAVFSVTPASRNPYFNMVELTNDGYVHLCKKIKKQITRRQDAPIVYDMNASIYVIWVNYLFLYNSYHTDQSRAYVMPRERSIDIDGPLDLEFVTYLMQKRR